MKNKATALVLLTLAASSLATASLAHHSGAMFDSQKQMTLVGAVKEFQWTNPHSWVQLNVAGSNGNVVEWSLETSSVSNLYKRGWRPSMLKPGDKVTVVISPLRNGDPGGIIKSVTTADGKTLS